MGQPIQVTATVLEDVLLIDGDRSITGQDGTGYGSLDEAGADDRFPGRLAMRIFESDGDVEHVFIASNQVVLRRSGGWDDEAVAGATSLIEDFFVYYR